MFYARNRAYVFQNSDLTVWRRELKAKGKIVFKNTRNIVCLFPFFITKSILKKETFSIAFCVKTKNRRRKCKHGNSSFSLETKNLKIIINSMPSAGFSQHNNEQPNSCAIVKLQHLIILVFLVKHEISVSEVQRCTAVKSII